MGFLDNAGLAHLWAKVKTALGLKMDTSVYDPTGRAEDVFAYADGKQSKLSGIEGQIVGFDENGNAIAQNDTGVILPVGSTSWPGSGTILKVDLPEFVLVEGVVISVVNTFPGIPVNGYPLHMDVNGTGAKPLRCNGVNLRGSDIGSGGARHIFQYDGTYWHLLNRGSLACSGGALYGTLHVYGSITGISTPVGSRDAVPKFYVDAKIAMQISIALTTAGWDATTKMQTVTATGVTADNAVIPAPAPASWEAAGQAGVRCTAQAADSLTFTCTKVPTEDLTYNVLIQEVQ